MGRVKVEETTVESIVILSYFELLVCTQIYHIRSKYCMNGYMYHLRLHHYLEIITNHSYV